MGNSIVGCDFCIRDRRNKMGEIASFDKEDPLKIKIDKFVKIHSKFLLSKSKEKVIYYSFITSSFYLLFSQSSYLALTSESIYVIDEYMMNVLKRIPLQYVIRIVKCENSGNIGIEHYNQIFKSPLMMLNMKENKDFLEIPKSYTDEILDKLTFFYEKKTSQTLQTFLTKKFKETATELQLSNFKSNELYKQIKVEFSQKIKQTMSEPFKIIRIYYIESLLSQESSSEKFNFLAVLQDRYILFEGKDLLQEISVEFLFKDLKIIACNEFISKFILRTDSFYGEFKSIYSEEIILAAKSYSTDNSLTVKILNEREFIEHQQINQKSKTINTSHSSSNFVEIIETKKEKLLGKHNYNHTSNLETKKLNESAELKEIKEENDIKSRRKSEENCGIKFENHLTGTSVNPLASDFSSKENYGVSKVENEIEYSEFRSNEFLEFSVNEHENLKEVILKFNNDMIFNTPLSTPFSIKHDDSIIDGEDMTILQLLKLASMRLWKMNK